MVFGGQQAGEEAEDEEAEHCFYYDAGDGRGACW
jgi:hypothetical protein